MVTQPTRHIPMQEEYDDPTIEYLCEDDEPLESNAPYEMVRRKQWPSMTITAVMSPRRRL